MIRRELRIYKNRSLADVAIMQFYSENKKDISKVYADYKSRGVLMKDGTKIYFKDPSVLETTQYKFAEIKHY